jgi:large subunit ribosomal protein L10
MSKPIKQLIVKEYQKRFDGLEGAVVIDLRGMPSNDNNALRLGLGRKNIRVTMVKNALAKQAFTGSPIEAINQALEGPCALTYTEGSVVDVAREIVKWVNKVKNLTLRGAVLGGDYFAGAEGVKRLSKFPTKEEAQGTVVTLVLSPARNVVGAVKDPGGRVLGIIKSIQERLEKGEAIAKVA